MIKAIFFDFDGTISDAYDIAYDSLVRVLGDYGYEFGEARLKKLMGSKMEIIFERLSLSRADGKRLMANCKKIRKGFYRYFTEAALNGGIKPCVSLKPLWDLKEDYPLIVVSNSETSFLRASVKKLKLKGLFKGIYGADKFKKKDLMLEKLFRKMLGLAEKIDKPVVIHSRKAELEAIEILEELKMKKVIMHCFCGRKSLIKRCVENGWFFSVPAVIKRWDNFRMLVEVVPLGQLLTETDAPLLSPVVGTRNEPVNVAVTIKEIARIKGLSEEKVTEQIFKNAVELFGL